NSRPLAQQARGPKASGETPAVFPRLLEGTMERQRARSREAPAVSGAARLIVPRHSLGSSTGSNNSSSAQRRSISEKDTKSTASTPPQAPVPPSPPGQGGVWGTEGGCRDAHHKPTRPPEQQRRRHVQKRKLTVSKSPSSHPPDKVGRAQCRDGPPRLRRACTAKTFKVSRLQCVSLCVIHTCAEDGTIMRFKDA
ncbi:hypothetical protein TGPRC2_427300, partial [Toxoplasma gondii TgCatPRC2]